MHVKQLYKVLKRHVTKSKPYFEMKARFTQTMQEQKGRSKTLENAVQLAKQVGLVKGFDIGSYKQLLWNIRKGLLVLFVMLDSYGWAERSVIINALNHSWFI